MGTVHVLSLLVLRPPSVARAQRLTILSIVSHTEQIKAIMPEAGNE
jgi:hypothetical protein